MKGKTKSCATAQRKREYGALVEGLGYGKLSEYSVYSVEAESMAVLNIDIYFLVKAMGDFARKWGGKYIFALVAVGE